MRCEGWEIGGCANGRQSIGKGGALEGLTLFFGEIDRSSFVPRERSFHPILRKRIDIISESLSPLPRSQSYQLISSIRRTFSLGGIGSFPSRLSPICRRMDFSRFPSRHQVDIFASSGMTFLRLKSAEKQGWIITSQYMEVEGRGGGRTWRKISATSSMRGIASGDLKKI